MADMIKGEIKCKLHLSAFSGEAVFQVNTKQGQNYEGIAPKHYIEPSNSLTKDGINGKVKVQVLSGNDEELRVYMPDEQILTVPRNLLV